MELYPGKQLFIDDFMIESMKGLRRVLNQAEKQTVIAPLDLPLDTVLDHAKGQIGDVVYDKNDGLFRMYYHLDLDGERRMCALNSEDGLHWEKPTLGLVEIDGSTANNVTNCPLGQLSLLWDPHETDEAYRWKRIDNTPTGRNRNGRKVWRAFHSRDGYDWKPYPSGGYSENQMLFNFGSPAETFGGTINPDANYVHYSQRGSSRRTRVLGRRDSEDFLHWSGLRTVIDQDLNDPAGTEFYGASFDSANCTNGGLHILMLFTFLTDLSEPYEIEKPGAYWGAESGPNAVAARIDGFVDTELAVSRDTVSWTRFREPFIPRGQSDSWDWGMLFSDAPILHNDKLWFFYSGFNLNHNGHTARLWESPYSAPSYSNKGLAVLRRDGYVSVEVAGFGHGTLTTHRFRQESGGSVQVNVDASAGELRYELLLDTGEPISGYTVADCDPIRADELDRTLSWNGVQDWPGVSSERQATLPNLPQSEFYIKIRFYLAPGTKLYSFTLNPPEVTMWNVKIKGRID